MGPFLRGVFYSTTGASEADSSARAHRPLHQFYFRIDACHGHCVFIEWLDS